MASVRQIAKEVGVSITTVSRALNNSPAVNPKTREQVLAAANRSGYVVPQGRRQSTQIGFAYTGARTISHPYDAAIIEGITNALEEHGFDLVILNLQHDKKPNESYAQFFLRRGVRGVLLRTMTETRHICRAIAEEGFPHMVISERFDSPRVHCIDCNSRPDSLRAVEYLILLGHRRIAFGVHNVADLDHVDRLEGYKEALAKHDIPYDEELVFRHPYTLAGGATIMKLAMSTPNRPTAIYLADPLLGVGAIKTAHQMGIKVPRDMSIIGFDDTDVRFGVHPTMTAVCQNARALGQEAALRLGRKLTNAADEPVHIAVPTFFEIHESTGPPPNGSSAPSVSGAFRQTRADRVGGA